MKGEVAESNLQFQEAWKLYARVSPGGEAFERGALAFADAKQPWFFMNVAALRTPIADPADLTRRAREALEYFVPHGDPWVLTGSEDWFGRDADSALSAIGLTHKTALIGMVAERLLPPTRPFPEVELRRIAEEESRLALSDLNADSYDVPREWGRSAIGSAALWKEPLFGAVAYIKGEPASGALALRIDEALYVGWVATAKTHRRKGLAELVIRDILARAGQATGLERTVLQRPPTAARCT
jgi:hypothetical protein